MSFESHYWRAMIARELRLLEKKSRLTHSDIPDEKLEEEFSKLEIKVMTLAYAARKLADAGKLPDAALAKQMPLIKHPRIGDSYRGYLSFADEYDLEVGEQARLSLREICNQIIHSYVLQALGNRQRAFKSIAFVSDRDRRNGLYELEIAAFIKLMWHVHGSWVTRMDSTYDSSTDTWRQERK